MEMIKQAVDALVAGDDFLAAEIASDFSADEGREAAIAYLQRVGELPTDRVTGAVMVFGEFGLASIVFAWRLDRESREIRPMPTAVYTPEGLCLPIPVEAARRFWAARPERFGEMPIELGTIRPGDHLWVVTSRKRFSILVMRAASRRAEFGEFCFEPMAEISRRAA